MCIGVIEWISATSSQGNRHLFFATGNLFVIDVLGLQFISPSLSSMHRQMPSDLCYPTAMTPHPTLPALAIARINDKEL